ncbi:hypothetical protein BOW53_02900 [Solemya pervernicosa gill symbiont]|uniref:2/3 transmembrane domain holin n=1 Tax=Solemya pervernicosa gill symbiont TaxID=642797 RepID=A0A1T2L9B8_9GAMM|nr:hypothetical protein BOW53_02900 [Solemya pervernicosa gill symbiont]
MENIQDKARGGWWLLAALLLIAVIAFTAKHQIGVLVWSLAKISVAAYLGYWIDRSMFREGRPDQQKALGCKHAAWYRRAAIISACIVGLSIAV